MLSDVKHVAALPPFVMMRMTIETVVTSGKFVLTFCAGFLFV
jgi:hypothetical protein